MKNISKIMLTCLMISTGSIAIAALGGSTNPMGADPATFSPGTATQSSRYESPSIVYPAKGTLYALYYPNLQLGTIEGTGTVTLKNINNDVMQYKFVNVTQGPTDNENAVKILQFKDTSKQRLTPQAYDNTFLFGELYNYSK